MRWCGKCSVGAVYDRAFFAACEEKRAVIDRAYRRQEEGTVRFVRPLGLWVSILILGTVAGYSQNSASSATTNDATAITTSAAQLNGVIVPGTTSTVAGWFEWGTTTALGKRTDPQIFSNPAATIALTATLSNLEPHTTYYFRTVLYGVTGGGSTI